MGCWGRGAYYRATRRVRGLTPTGCESQPHLFSALRPRISHYIFLSLHFHTCRTGIIHSPKAGDRVKQCRQSTRHSRAREGRAARAAAASPTGPSSLSPCPLSLHTSVSTRCPRCRRCEKTHPACYCGRFALGASAASWLEGRPRAGGQGCRRAPTEFSLSPSLLLSVSHRFTLHSTGCGNQRLSQLRR